MVIFNDICVRYIYDIDSIVGCPWIDQELEPNYFNWNFPLFISSKTMAINTSDDRCTCNAGPASIYKTANLGWNHVSDREHRLAQGKVRAKIELRNQVTKAAIWVVRLIGSIEISQLSKQQCDDEQEEPMRDPLKTFQQDKWHLLLLFSEWIRLIAQCNEECSL